MRPRYFVGFVALSFFMPSMGPTVLHMDGTWNPKRNSRMLHQNHGSASYGSSVASIASLQVARLHLVGPGMGPELGLPAAHFC